MAISPLFGCELIVPSGTQYSTLGMCPDAHTNDIRDAQRDLTLALQGEKAEAERELAAVHAAVPGLAQAAREHEAAVGRGAAGPEVRAAARRLAEQQSVARAVNQDYQRVVERLRRVEAAINELNVLDLTNPTKRREYDQANPPFELLKFADCTRDGLADPAVAMALLRKAMVEFLDGPGKRCTTPATSPAATSEPTTRSTPYSTVTHERTRRPARGRADHAGVRPPVGRTAFPPPAARRGTRRGTRRRAAAPPPARNDEHLEEIAEDLLDLMKRAGRLEEGQAAILARLDRLDATVRDGLRAQSRELDLIRRDLLAGQGATAARAAAGAVLPAVDRLRPLQVQAAKNRRRNEPLANQLDAAMEILTGMLRALGFTAFEPPLGAAFDPTSMQYEGDAKGPPGVVLGVVRPGYRSHDAVFRPAGVLLAPAPKPH